MHAPSLGQLGGACIDRAYSVVKGLFSESSLHLPNQSVSNQRRIRYAELLTSLLTFGLCQTGAIRLLTFIPARRAATEGRSARRLIRSVNFDEER